MWLGGSEAPMMGTRKSSTTATIEKIEEMVRRIVTQFNPDRVVLFGSHARGTGGPGSDADLLVIMPAQGSRRRQATQIDLALVGIDLPADVIVVTPDDVERNRNQIGTIIHSALLEGQVLYERKT
jgi:predicted nucleotidyltransferase